MIWIILLYLAIGWALTRFVFANVFDWTLPGDHDYAVDYDNIVLAVLFWLFPLGIVFVEAVIIPAVHGLVQVLFYKR